MIRLVCVIAVASTVGVVSSLSAETVRWTRSGDSLTLDPHSQNEQPTHAVSHQIHDALLYQDMDLEIQPGLATDWQVSEDDPSVWVFHVREGVRFHQGQALTADDVEFSINRARHENSDMRGLLASIVDVRATGDYTVEIETDGPNPLLPNNFTNLFIMSREWAEEHGVEVPTNYAAGEESHAVRNANGTGPFRLESREPDVRTVLVRNDDYWGRDHYPMEVSRIVSTPIESAATRVAALLSGEVDLLQEAPVQDIQRLSQADGIKIEQGPENRTIFLGMDVASQNLRSADVDGNPFADHRVREAMNIAIDREAIQRSVMRGNSQPAGVIAPPFVYGYSEELDQLPRVDQERARELLAEAGYPDGFRVSLHCPNDRYVNDEQICQAVVGMLGRIGINIDLVSQTRSVHFAELARQEYDFYMLGWGVPPMDSEYIFNYLYHTKQDNLGTWNFTGFSNERVDELTRAMARVTDEEEREAVVNEAWEIVHGEIIYLPLHHQMLTWAMREDIDFQVQSENTPHFKYLRFIR
ncbi:peptide/nickel transport system substrate-binding protein [Natronocella acetinitrilica]|uniref:Peptide/nickel transport system substrate-binding protein n=1 Tax=Natronocella acetinitrilica TaxID=414046 RepID=A0AAE3G5A3_9GAMM|nr:ABC transporter substrate-binding protein [Natronocella acetinitrilica]MCP1674668.1 peptide/nickel transport system substrate-binding protein [Natronocella acetinitrilica]